MTQPPFDPFDLPMKMEIAQLRMIMRFDILERVGILILRRLNCCEYGSYCRKIVVSFVSRKVEFNEIKIPGQLSIFGRDLRDSGDQDALQLVRGVPRD